MVALDRHTTLGVGWISLAALARDVLGTKAKGAGRAGRDWCKARGVPYVRDGKLNFARVEDVRRAIERNAGIVEVDRAAAVSNAVAKLQRTG